MSALEQTMSGVSVSLGFEVLRASERELPQDFGLFVTGSGSQYADKRVDPRLCGLIWSMSCSIEHYAVDAGRFRPGH